MAENRVRDMYEGVDSDEMTEKEKEEHIARTLRENPDVLFRIYCQGRPHMVFLRPTNPGEWTRVILSRITTNLSFQMTKKRGVDNIFTITMSGTQEELGRLCDDFDQLYVEVMTNSQDGGAAAQINPEDDVEEVRARIKELDLENKKLQKQ